MTVLYKNSRRTNSGKLVTYWHCKCECGRECDKDAKRLKTGKDVSCGVCSPRSIRKDAEDLTGQRFGRLTVMKINMQKREEAFKAKKSSQIYWDCLCDCGNWVTVRASHLKEGTIVSCGCYHSDIVKTVVPQLNWKTNKIISQEDSMLIKSSNSDDYFIIDAEDYDKVKNYCWHNSHGYAQAPIRGQKNKTIRMQRLIMDCGEDEEFLVVDHINHNTLDNRKCNLRIATDTQNNWNTKRSHNSQIQYNNNIDKWKVSITYNAQIINLGFFDSYDEALIIRDKAEKVFYEEFQYQEEICNEK